MSYRLLLLCLKLVMVVAAPAIKTSWDQAARDHVLKIHNDLRSGEKGCSVNKLVYDNELEKEAKEKAERCIFKQEINDGKGQVFAQENKETSEEELITSATQRWFDEKKNYSLGQKSCKDACHYTQMVWASTQKVGCYSLRCKNDAWNFVCVYTPKGNTNGGKPYEKSCTEKCQGGQTEENGLCVVGSEGNTGAGVGVCKGEGCSDGASKRPTRSEPDGEFEPERDSESEGESGRSRVSESEGESEPSRVSEPESESGRWRVSGSEVESGRWSGSGSEGVYGRWKVSESEVESGRWRVSGSEGESGPWGGSEHGGDHTAGGGGGEENDCKDENDDCFRRFLHGQCTEHAELLKSRCRRSCYFCQSVCADSDASCPSRARKGECKSNASVMKRECEKSCKLCANKGECDDYNENCRDWHEAGYCIHDPATRALCKKTCNTCET